MRDAIASNKGVAENPKVFTGVDHGQNASTVATSHIHQKLRDGNDVSVMTKREHQVRQIPLLTPGQVRIVLGVVLRARCGHECVDCLRRTGDSRIAAIREYRVDARGVRK